MPISSIRVIVGIIFFCLGLAAAIASGIFTIMMIGEINRQRKEDNQISYLGYHPLKMVQIPSEYRRLYPNGRLHQYANATFIIMAIALIIMAVCFRIIG